MQKWETPIFPVEVFFKQMPVESKILQKFSFLYKNSFISFNVLTYWSIFLFQQKSTFLSKEKTRSSTRKDGVCLCFKRNFVLEL